MTTPAERTEAVKLAMDLAVSLTDNKKLRIGGLNRARVVCMLRYLPTLGELALTHEKCPELWGKP